MDFERLYWSWPTEWFVCTILLSSAPLKSSLSNLPRETSTDFCFGPYVITVWTVFLIFGMLNLLSSDHRTHFHGLSVKPLSPVFCIKLIHGISPQKYPIGKISVGDDRRSSCDDQPSLWFHCSCRRVPDFQRFLYLPSAGEMCHNHGFGSCHDVLKILRVLNSINSEMLNIIWTNYILSEIIFMLKCLLIY